MYRSRKRSYVQGAEYLPAPSGCNGWLKAVISTPWSDLAPGCCSRFHRDRIYAVEWRRDVEPGPLGLPWRSRFRLAAYDADSAAAWTFAAAPDDVISDVAVRP